ncbi:MAG: PIN domain-containing protein [Calditrichaceae bacterium]|nr:PIN domain-containing protein [Calditrichaceae bacterium]
MITAIDTNILLDILIPNQEFLESSLSKLEECAGEGNLIICEHVYTELACQFNNAMEINRFLQDTKIEVKFSDIETFYEASLLWKSYQAKISRQYYCPNCGKQVDTICSHCNYPLNMPRRVLNDFIIGSHARRFADVFLTRDRGFYRNYFKQIKMI